MRLIVYQRVFCYALSGRAGIGKSDPRALPWANLCWPFGPEEIAHNSVSPTFNHPTSGLERFASIRVHSWFAISLILLFAANASAENLVANPGFEDLAGDKPARWDHFVQPMPGADAALSDSAHGGAYAVKLHIPAPYEKEPVNNWSQNIMGDFGGKTLRVSGFIRVEDAKEATIWLQLWRKKPWGVLGAASTSIDMPVYGTQDWQEVSMDVPVPEGADFVTLRCVLMGSGTAWFDDLSVTLAEDAEPEEKTEAPAKSPEPSLDAPESKADAAAERATGDVESPAVEEIMAEEDVELAGPDEAFEQPLLPQDTVLPLVNDLEAEVRRLRSANEVLTDTLQEIQSVNQELLKEMMAVQEELQEMKAGKNGAAAPALQGDKPRVPPLIPLSESQEYGAP